MRSSVLPLPLLILLSVFAEACAGIHPLLSDGDAPPGSLRLGVVVRLVLREEVLSNPDALADLRSGGIGDKDLRDGSLVQIALHCCNGPNVTTYGYAYAPPAIQLQQGDVVEIRVGRESEAAGLERLNQVIRVRELAGTEPSQCLWLPLGKGLWMRAIYCGWMPAEGWTGVKNYLGQTVVWIKPAP